MNVPEWEGATAEPDIGRESGVPRLVLMIWLLKGIDPLGVGGPQ